MEFGMAHMHQALSYGDPYRYGGPQNTASPSLPLTTDAHAISRYIAQKYIISEDEAALSLKRLGTELLEALENDDKRQCIHLLSIGAPLLGTKDNRTVSILNEFVRKQDTPLFLAALNMSIEEERFAKDDSGKTYLHHAVELKNSSILKAAFSSEIDCTSQPVNCGDNKGNTPLLCIVDNHKPTKHDRKKIEILVKMGNSNLNITNDRLENALHLTIRGDYSTEIVGLLIKNGAVQGVNAHRRRLGETPLHIAMRLKKYDIAENLIKFGADLLAMNQFKQTCADLIDDSKGGTKLKKKLKITSFLEENKRERKSKHVENEASCPRELPLELANDMGLPIAKSQKLLAHESWAIPCGVYRHTTPVFKFPIRSSSINGKEEAVGAQVLVNKNPLKKTSPERMDRLNSSARDGYSSRAKYLMNVCKIAGVDIGKFGREDSEVAKFCSKV